ncbi:glucose 1-dehydrogenase [Nocardia cyriacigeorgica]|uniref:glucose 1-dehydrogenase n=1 Tax=Nocardia cyriacigeorgica TaxID=135487 RepID=UPI0013D7671F|nr:glucose 1-dehydrogenase [Nocardia cyriacigeorgica]MBF6434803.1 glucose 1-dehydrogenase [Nocardia cyriacigeorgica]MBF6455113.1 glucose 1-dehydrogenase [Nocardia cyriacigeorgica]MBF6478868.1 glucose 1-dehydrogenase [Nocardia cyriacigeorgica]MBF6553008.1 glucose 1-dehydrogenase [Nocardia cyriacigeorgica]NEW26805.1 glucose 1-dehydrogenase [Nocardia cyriacigeorgica]
MRALTVDPARPESLRLDELPDPEPGPGELLVDGLAVGVCGTDRDIADGAYGTPPPGKDRLILGHESLGRVRSAPDGSDFSAGDLVVGVVRRPDPVPCEACARGEFDNCRNGRYTERGIKELDGYGAEQWCVDPEYAVTLDPRLARVGVLLEPASVVAKAWEQVERIGERGWFAPSRVLVTGAGPIGLLAALLGSRRGLDVHVLDRVEHGAKPRLVRDLGATYHHGDAAAVAESLRPDIIIEATGANQVVFAAMGNTAPFGVVCLTGVSPVGRLIEVDAGAVHRDIVLENDVVVGSVNANLRHYRLAADALAAADPAWLDGLITRRLPLTKFADAFTPDPDDVKVVIALDEH